MLRAENHGSDAKEEGGSVQVWTHTLLPSSSIRYSPTIASVRRVQMRGTRYDFNKRMEP